MTRLLCALLILPLVGGCHARFKKHAPTIADARAEVGMPGGPVVNLGGVQGDGLVAAVVNAKQGIDSIQLSRRVGDAVDPSLVADAFADELDATLGKGPPFDVEPGADTVLQIVVTHYGIDVPGLGAPGALTYSLNTQVFLPDGKKVYNANHSCVAGFGNPDAAAIVFGTVNNKRAIESMSPDELQDLFAGGARWCAQQTALRIRRHGS